MANLSRQFIIPNPSWRPLLPAVEARLKEFLDKLDARLDGTKVEVIISPWPHAASTMDGWALAFEKHDLLVQYWEQDDSWTVASDIPVVVIGSFDEAVAQRLTGE